jgi:hypothetical protein
MSELRGPADYWDVLSDPAQPLIVGGQAVNLWAEVYTPSEPALQEFQPFTSKDADIFGNRELAQVLHRRSGWSCQFFDAVRQPAVAVLTKLIAGTDVELRIEVIQSADAQTVTKRHGLDLTAAFPDSLSTSPHAKVRRWAEHQLPRLRPRRPAAN